MAKPAIKPETDFTVLSTQEEHERLISGVLAQLADSATAQADKGKLAIDALLTFQDWAIDRVTGNKTQAYQRLAAFADPALLGKRSGFKGRKPFLLAMFAKVLPLDTKGQPDATQYLKILNAWRQDVRAGLDDMARGGVKKKKSKKNTKPTTLAAALTFVEKKLPRLEGGQSERDTLKGKFDAWYERASAVAA
jgi:hypothetical protein